MPNFWMSTVIDALSRRDRDAAAETLDNPAGGGRPLGVADESLRLHLGALLAFARGDRELAAVTFEQAATLESGEGWAHGAQHTSHQWALLAPENGSLGRSKKYYAESIRHLRAAKNWLGAGLCARSLGELAILVGQPDQALSLWHTAQVSLERAGAMEAKQVRGWRALVQDGAAPDGSARDGALHER